MPCIFTAFCKLVIQKDANSTKRHHARIVLAAAGGSSGKGSSSAWQSAFLAFIPLWSCDIGTRGPPVADMEQACEEDGLAGALQARDSARFLEAVAGTLRAKPSAFPTLKRQIATLLSEVRPTGAA